VKNINTNETYVFVLQEHKEFMEAMARRQPEVDSICKPRAVGRQPVTKGKQPAAVGRLRSQTPA